METFYFNFVIMNNEGFILSEDNDFDPTKNKPKRLFNSFNEALIEMLKLSVNGNIMQCLPEMKIKHEGNKVLVQLDN